jgi:alpha-D-ribose 1-methylphosphonate 5-triphosphate synthase subunit PhnG
MTLEQLIGKYFRLRAELAAAYNALYQDPQHIDRLHNEMGSTGVAIIQAQPMHEQTCETMPGIYDERS